MSRVRALIIASHPRPTLAISAMATLLAAQAAPPCVGPCDARRDAGAGRSDKPIATGRISVRAVWIAAFTAVVAPVVLFAAGGDALT